MFFRRQTMFNCFMAANELFMYELNCPWKTCPFNFFVRKFVKVERHERNRPNIAAKRSFQKVDNAFLLPNPSRKYTIKSWRHNITLTCMYLFCRFNYIKYAAGWIWTCFSRPNWQIQYCSTYFCHFEKQTRRNLSEIKATTRVGNT